MAVRYAVSYRPSAFSPRKLVSPPRKVLVSWSSGKDSAWMLHQLRQEPSYEIGGLLTTINESAARVAMHAVRVALLEAQAAAAGLPLWQIPLPSPCSNEEYERRMGAAVDRAIAEGFTHVAFGGLFLEDVREYRERQLAPTPLEPIFPLWQIPTDQLARAMIAGGLRATITCVDPKQLSPSFAGREFDLALLNDLPPGVDPCGERGEFHSFAYAAPMFDHDIAIERGVVVERDGFIFTDVKPAGLPIQSGTMVFDVFGRRVTVVRSDGKWNAFYGGADGKRRLARDIVIPSELQAEEIARYLSDLCHEWASTRSPDVRSVG